MRSEKLKLLTGSYKIIGYKLFDKLDEVITGISTGEDETFEVVSRGLTTKDLVTDSQTRGTVTFKLVKDGLATRVRRRPGHRLLVQRHKDYRCNGDQYIYTRTSHHQKSEGLL